MYVSDYMYAVGPNGWQNIGYDSNNISNDYREIKGDNWMYIGFVDWTVSRCTDNTNLAFGIGNDGYVNTGLISDMNTIRPVFYLNSDVEIYEGHAGTASDPYRIVI